MKRNAVWFFRLVGLVCLVVSPKVFAGAHLAEKSEPFQGALAGLPPEAQNSIVNQLAKLTASDGVSGDVFGFSAAVSGNTVVIGAPYASVGGNSFEGAAYVFVKPESGWTDMTETAKLTPSDGGVYSLFGTAVAISGNTIVVEAGSGGAVIASAYVFVEPHTGWADVHETAKLTSPASYAGGGASPSVATNGNTVVLGVPWTGYQNQEFEGVVYVYSEPTGGWRGTSAPTGRLVLSSGFEEIYFGQSVSISGDTVVATARAGPALNSAAYVFVKPTNGWAKTQTETATLTASNVDGVASVAISGNTIAAGAPGAIIGTNVAQGAVYIFVKPSTGWVSMTETAKLTASDGAANDALGASVALVSGGNQLAAGADRRSTESGAVYSFVKPSTGWKNMNQSAEFAASDGSTGDWLGASVGMAGSRIVSGATQLTNSGPGAAYLFGPK